MILGTLEASPPAPLPWKSFAATFPNERCVSRAGSRELVSNKVDLDLKDSFLEDKIGVVLFVFRVEFTVFAFGKQFQLVEATRTSSGPRSLGKDVYSWSHPVCTVLTILLRVGWCGRYRSAGSPGFFWGCFGEDC